MVQVSWSQAVQHQDYLGAGLPDLSTWQHWLAVGKSIFGEPLTDDELTKFREVCGWDQPPSEQVDEVWICKGRRGGGTQFSASVAVYLATFKADEFKKHLSPGETAAVLCLSQDKDQAATLLGYIQGILEASPKLNHLLPRTDSGEIKDPTGGDTIKLTNGVVVKVKSASFRGLRGFTAIGVLCDEIAFWRDSNSRNPADHILKAVRPTLGSMPGSMLLAFSSVWGKSGVLWDHFKKYHQRDADDPGMICFRGTTKQFNPTFPQEKIDKALKRDPLGGKTEYLSLFRDDVSTLFTDTNLDPVIVPNRRVLPPQDGVQYVAAVDASGGSSDSFTLAISHRGQLGMMVLDRVEERQPPFSPSSVCLEFSKIMKQYRCTSAAADSYAKGWVKEGFLVNGIKLIQEGTPAKTFLYSELLARVNSEEVELLDHDKLRGQLECLERIVRPGGQERILEPANTHEDIANAAALSIWALAESMVEEEPCFIIGDEVY